MNIKEITFLNCLVVSNATFTRTQKISNKPTNCYCAVCLTVRLLAKVIAAVFYRERKECETTPSVR